MSAFIVGTDHIDYLVTAAIDLGTGRGYGLYWREEGKPSDTVRLDNADAFGAMLLAECIASVWYRYQRDTFENLPGPNDKTRPKDYRFQRFRPFDGHELDTIAQVMKAIACYEYQSCEHPGWDDSEAKRVCDALCKAYTYRLPGYEEAQWEIEREDEA